MSVCFECSAEENIFNHHVVPRSLGGGKTIPLCGDCHGKAHGRKSFSSELTKGAMRRKKTRGEYTGGRVPYGFCLSGSSLVADTFEQRVISEVVRLSSKGLTLRGVSRALEEKGIMSRAGKAFSASSIRGILNKHVEHIDSSYKDYESRQTVLDNTKDKD